MKRTAWTNERLQHLFERYNQLYWKGNLPRYSVSITSLWNGARCEKKNRKILINIDSHASDLEIRQRLVHEMAHAATNIGHGRLWKMELDRLRIAGAPTMKIDFLPGISWKGMLTGFVNATHEGATWRQVRSQLGWEYGLVNRNGRTTDRAMARLLENAKRIFQRERRASLSPRLRVARLEGLFAAASTKRARMKDLRARFHGE